MTAPIRREVIVATTPDRAFAQFTEQIGSWWPLQTLSVHRFEGLHFIVDGAIERFAVRPIRRKRVVAGERAGDGVLGRGESRVGQREPLCGGLHRQRIGEGGH